jgi:hypothetical protein
MSPEDSIVRESILSRSIGCRRRRCFTVASPVTAIAIWLTALGASFGAEDPNSHTDPQFSLLQGKGVPVCEAYLELLNKTKFEVTPFCGRPGEGDVKGFEHLERHYLGEPEITPLFTYVWEFMRFNDQHHVESFYYPNINPAKAHRSSQASEGDEIPESLRLGWMRVWTYAMPLDVNNNGSALNILIWQGYGATGDGARCGVGAGSLPWTAAYSHQRAFVLTADRKTIDEEQTRRIFGAPEGRTRDSMFAEVPGGGTPARTPHFRPFADSIGVFKYEGRIYIETEDQPTEKDAAQPPVHVFLREGASTRQVCSLHPVSVPVPVD